MGMDSMLRRSVGTLNRLTTPRKVIGASKYMLIKQLLDDFRINLIFDVGANVGQFGQSMREIGYRGRLLSFEPVSAQFEALQGVSSKDSDWTAMNVAVGSTEEMKTINIMQRTVFSSFKSPSASQTTKFENDNSVIKTEEVRVKRLDTVIDELVVGKHLHRAFLKSDTQGFEKYVLEGSGDKLSEIRMLMLEVSAIPIYEDALPMTDMIRYLTDHQFSPVAFFPVNFLSDWSALEFDCLCVNERYRA